MGYRMETLKHRMITAILKGITSSENVRLIPTEYDELQKELKRFTVLKNGKYNFWNVSIDGKFYAYHVSFEAYEQESMWMISITPNKPARRFYITYSDFGDGHPDDYGDR